MGNKSGKETLDNEETENPNGKINFYFRFVLEDIITCISFSNAVRSDEDPR